MFKLELKKISVKDWIIIVILVLILGFNGVARVVEAFTPESKITTIVQLALADIIKEQQAPLLSKVQGLEDEIKSVKQELAKITKDRQWKVLTDILKQGAKIEKGDDMYMEDFGRLLGDWKSIPESMKNPEYIRIVNKMKNIYYGDQEKGAG